MKRAGMFRGERRIAQALSNLEVQGVTRAWRPLRFSAGHGGTLPAPSFAEFVEVLIRADRPIRVSELHIWLGHPREPQTPTEALKVLRVLADQLGRWTAEFELSLEASPNREAEAQVYGWASMWDYWARTLAASAIPIEELRCASDMRALFHVTVRREALKRTGTVQRCRVAVLGVLGIALHRIGLRSLGRRVYGCAVYPAGTVGRAQIDQPA